MKKIILYHICIVFFLSCFSPKKEQVEDIPQKTENLLIKIDDIIDNNKFDIIEYKIKVDSLFSKIFSEKINSNLIIDTINKMDLIFNFFKSSPLENITKHTNWCIRYDFNIINDDVRRKKQLIIFDFKTQIESDSCFVIFEKFATDTNYFEIFVPGLTYTNDYLVLIKNKIYWINSSCMYSYENHLKFVEELKKILNITNEKTINCECGNWICNRPKKNTK